MYADDTQLYVPFEVGKYEQVKKRLEGCIAEMRRWMAENHLKLNDQKTEYIILGRKYEVKKIQGEKAIIIGESKIEPSECVKNIGAVLDSGLEMKPQVNNIAKASYLHMRNIGHIRPNLSEHTAATLVHAFISSKLDNLNSLLVGIPETVIRKLQLIQNNAARLVLRKKRREHITPLLQQLHWLPIKYRIKYKICILTYKALHGLAPSYIKSLIEEYVPRRDLRSRNRCLLTVKKANLAKTGGRSFSVCAPVMWNSLPEHLRKANSLNGFKIGLKTGLFREAFGV